MNEEHGLPYRDLRAVADQILEVGEDDPEALALALGHLAPEVRDELLVSDLLNAWQAFFWFFREDPGELERDRLILEPASALPAGVFVTEIEMYEVVFRVEAGEPVVSVILGAEAVAEFRGRTAYSQGIRFINDTIWET